MRTRLSNNFSLKILAFLAAGLLWLIVVNIDDPIMDQNNSDQYRSASFRGFSKDVSDSG